MLGLTTYSPATASVLEVVHRAVQEVGDVSGAFVTSPCSFVPLVGKASSLVDSKRPAGAGRGEWVLVTVRCSAEVGHQVHLHERCRTAAQRFVLTLACEGVESVWMEGVPDAASFRSAGLEVGACEPVGLVWCTAE